MSNRHLRPKPPKPPNEAGELSSAAVKLLARLRAGAYYAVSFSGRRNKSMEELMECGLVTQMPRYPIIKRYWVPVGSIPAGPEYIGQECDVPKGKFAKRSI